jgi:hypothetical protein
MFGLIWHINPPSPVILSLFCLGFWPWFNSLNFFHRKDFKFEICIGITNTNITNGVNGFLRFSVTGKEFLFFTDTAG